jgi:hypothetical protein
LQTTGANYKLIKKVKDDRFDEDNLHQYRLLIQLGIRDFQVAVVAENDNRLLFFEDYVLSELNSYHELLNLLKALFDAHEFLQAGFWREVKISIKNNKFIQLPKALFLEENSAEYLKFNASVDSAFENILHCENNSLAITTVFSMQKLILEWLQSSYQNTQLKIFHQSAALIEGVIQISKSSTSTPLYVYVDRFKMHLISADKGKLIYYNQFIIHQFADYVKYIMLVMKTVGMDQQTSEVMLWGYIGKNSPHYLEFVKYVRNVSFGGRPTHMSFGYMFDDVQEHQFFDLYSLDLLS